jgi:hypothetical protein
LLKCKRHPQSCSHAAMSRSASITSPGPTTTSRSLNAMVAYIVIFRGIRPRRVDARIGLGPSAISRLPIGFVQKHVDVASYSRVIEAGKLASARRIAVTPDDSVRGTPDGDRSTFALFHRLAVTYLSAHLPPR